MQFYSCYPSSEITIKELPNYDEAVITTNDSTVYFLKRSENIREKDLINNPDYYFSNNWLIKPDVEKIFLITQKAYIEKIQDSTSWNIVTDSTNLNYTDIKYISRMTDVGEEFLLFTTIIVLFFLTLAVLIRVIEDAAHYK